MSDKRREVVTCIGVLRIGHKSLPSVALAIILFELLPARRPERIGPYTFISHVVLASGH